MNILFINCTCGNGSTGKIVVQKAIEYDKEGHNVRIAYGRDEFIPEELLKYAIRIGTNKDLYAHVILTRLFDKHGLASKKATAKFIRWAESFSPDLLWLHNIHGYFINYEMLFSWIKTRPEMEVKWTLHDCWAFTGHCVHFESVKCNKWKSGCYRCPLSGTYPGSFLMDNSENNYERKKDAFQGVSKLSIITPSKWLASMVSESFLKEYPISVVHNSINTEIFCPRKSNFKNEIKSENKFIVLGVASEWYMKGFEDFIQLATILGEEYKVVLVGLSMKEIARLPHTMVGLARTRNQEKLAEIYTAADVFVNLTYQDTYPTVNLEAQACGTPCITYRTGGSPESVPEQNVLEQGDIEGVANLIRTRSYKILEKRDNNGESL